jgi:amidohydrolase
VVSIGAIHGGQRWNIIPDSVTLDGTIRTFNAQTHEKVLKSFNRIVHDTAAAHGATVEITMEDLVPVTHNDPELGKSALPALASVVGEGNVITEEPSTGMDDFAYFAQKVPGFYIHLGVRNEKIGATYPIHNEHFMLDEAALPLGMRAMAMMALDYLRTHSAPRRK